MKLTGIKFGNYKAFPGLNSIEIRPLTIFIGRNSSGKSAIARLPMLISRAMSKHANANIELEINGMGVNYGNELVDLIHNRKTHGAIDIGVNLVNEDGLSIGINVTVQHYDHHSQSILNVSKFQCQKEKEEKFTLVWIGDDPIVDNRKYLWEEKNKIISVDFRGCLPPRLVTEPLNDKRYVNDIPFPIDFDKIRNSFTELTEKTTYLGPFREEPKSFYKFPISEIRSVGLKGINAPGILGFDYRKLPSLVFDAVSNWFAEYLGGWKLGLTRQGDGFSLVMINPENPSIEINMADVGYGITQVLPIVVQRQYESVTENYSSIEIVEQPELHLHSAAHGDLADLYINAVRKSNTTFIIETHSENFLLRVRRRIAEGMDHEKAIIYWTKDEPGFGSKLFPIHIDECGEVDNWPEGVWAEDFEEVKLIRKAQRNNRKCK